jgi:uncharacterized protein
MTDDTLTKLDPRHINVSRITAAITAIIPGIGAIVIEVSNALPRGLVIVPVLLLAAYFIFVVPARRYHYWGYEMGADRLRIVRGYLFHSDTVVPFGRIQHIDVSQGPIERPHGLATLTVHTAGNHNSSVSVPGLTHEDAIAMREDIRAHIKRDTI